ncbi:methylated-DNA--[protein]-cysteine S-methyltransferase [Actinotalea sp.]|uniref:methylated-DNA--[protein]-cysteine S-methyltransferase n=1 Tax=Actinotalea sp. TaxID=1872145 RepID=UPI0035647E18
MATDATAAARTVGSPVGGTATGPSETLALGSPARRVVLACRAMVGAGGPLPAQALADLTLTSSRQLARDFRSVIGVTARDFGAAVRTGEARTLLRDLGQVTEAVFAAGYSVRGFYEETGPTLGMPPRSFAAGAPSELLRWTTVSTELGWVIAVAGDLGLADVRIGQEQDALVATIAAEYPRARLVRADEDLAAVADALRSLTAGRPGVADLPLDLRGTAFQATVWSALRRIPAGQTRTYTEVAAEIGSPRSVRAVARACATNHLALVVPCHRVVRADGSLGGYQWGLEVKERLLDLERRATG